MTAGIQAGSVQTGVRPFDPFRDLEPVVDLIDVAFGEWMDPAGRAVLDEMRRIARWGVLLSWLYWPGWSNLGGVSGFVWVDGGRVVGNASLRRVARWGGFLIGNVAVHPDWQGRGVAGALMEAVLEEVSIQGGRWAGLEVQSGNKVARHLYERLGFREVGQMLHMLRAAGLPWEEGSPAHLFSLRRADGRHHGALVQLARGAIPEPLRPLVEMREEDYRLGWGRMFDLWLEGRREAWWVVEEGGQVSGAVRVLRERGRRPDRMEVLIAPGRGESFAQPLVAQGITALHGATRKMVETVLTEEAEAVLIDVLERVGFCRARTLVQMRLDLGQRIWAKDVLAC